MSKPEFCGNCGSPVQKGASFCVFCGTKIQKKLSPAGAFFLSLAKCIAYFGVFFLIRNIVDAIYIGVITGKLIAASPNGISGVTDEMLYEEYSYLAPEVAILGSFLVIVCYLIFFHVRKKHFTNETALKKAPVPSLLAMLILGVCSQVIVAIGISILYTAFPDMSNDSYSKLYELMFKHSNPYTEFAYIAVITPFMEEVVFRGLIYTRLKKGMNKALAMLLSSIFFGLAHGNAEQFFYTSILGLLMVLVYEKYDSLWAPIAIHAAFNGSNFLLQSLEFSNNAYYLILTFTAIGLFFITTAFVFFTDKVAVSELSKSKELSDYEAL